MSMAYEEYMRELVKPMREELVGVGFKELKTAEEVETFMEGVSGTTLVVVNSVCGCAGGLARPAVTYAIQHTEKNLIISLRYLPGKIKKLQQKCGNILSVLNHPHLQWHF